MAAAAAQCAARRWVGDVARRQHDVILTQNSFDDDPAEAEDTTKPAVPLLGKPACTCRSQPHELLTTQRLGSLTNLNRS